MHGKKSVVPTKKCLFLMSSVKERRGILPRLVGEQPIAGEKHDDTYSCLDRGRPDAYP